MDINDKKDEKGHQEYLDKFLTDTGGGNTKPPVKTFASQSPDLSSIEYLNVSLDILPTGMFYKRGTQIKIRGAKVQEVQAYSVVDDGNYIDITEKMNDMLSSCVRFIHPDGSIGSYKNIKDADRIYLIFMVRELTFQKGNSLAKEVTCDGCNHEFKIVFRATQSPNQPKTFVNYEMPENINKFFDQTEKVYKFVINDVEWKLAPPTLGIQEIFFDTITQRVKDKKDPNISFLKIIPYLLYDRDKISEDGIKAKEKDFKAMDMDTFQILNKAVDSMKFGVKELKMTCPECNREVHSDMTFPEGASSIFLIPDIFDNFIKE